MPKPSPARLAALRTLETASRGQQPIQRVLDDHLSRIPLSVADRALCTELVYGVLRLERRLNWIIDHFLRQPGKTSPAACVRSSAVRREESVPLKESEANKNFIFHYPALYPLFSCAIL